MNAIPWMSPTAPSQPWRLAEPRLSQPVGVSDPIPAPLKQLAAAFAPISLADMNGVALLDRVDVKFVLTTPQLLRALETLLPYYWMLDVQDRRLNRYRTLYFDTPNFDLYQAHVTRRPERYKVRSREYADSHLAFLEVKHRTRKDRTIKERILTARPVSHMTPDLQDWLRSVAPLDGRTLLPSLWNTFTRLTLVSKQGCERVTLDLDLAFASDDRRVQLPGMVVAEVKMAMGHQASPFLVAMRAQQVRQHGFSKYAYGVATLYDQVKKNAMKPKQLWVEKVMKGSR